MSKQISLNSSLALIFEGIQSLKDTFPNREFTIDGRLVGDIGEVLASHYYDLELDAVSQPKHDGTTGNGLRVQVKATFQSALTFKTVPDYYLGLKLNRDGSFEEIYNGPGQLIYDRYSHRKGIGLKLLRFPNKQLSEISNRIPSENKILLR